MNVANLVVLSFLLAARLHAIIPEHTVENGVVRLKGVGPDNPILYDNDWWTDVPDAAYVWAKASLGEAKLVGNVITRCTFGWETKYAHTLKQQTDEAAKLFRLARESGLKHIPEPVIGSTVAIRKPASGKVDDTKFERTAGSALIVAEAQKASPEKPLLVFVGGSCTTIASAFLTDPTMTNRVIVFQIDGGGYNGSDQWAWDITMRRFRFVNWARSYFWDKVNTWKPERFKELPQNPLCDFLREYSRNDLGKANQWGDGAWLFQLFAPGCLTSVEDYNRLGITVPRASNNVKAMEDEFFRTMKALKPVAETRDNTKPPQGFVPLFSDDALTHWRQCGPGRFVVTNGVATGEGGMGLWWYAGRQFTNFVLRGEFVQEQEMADSGVFLRFPDPGPDPWVAVNKGHEMEIGDPASRDPTWRTGSIYPLAASTKANTKPLGQWNTFEITCNGQDYTVRINDDVVNHWTDPKARTDHGFIGLQNYNDNKTVRHRNLRIKELP